MSEATILGLVAGICATFAFLPQVIRTWRTRSTSDISLGMFTVMVIGNGLWLFYGIMIGDLPLIASNGVTLLFSATILVFKVRYG